MYKCIIRNSTMHRVLALLFVMFFYCNLQLFVCANKLACLNAIISLWIRSFEHFAILSEFLRFFFLVSSFCILVLINTQW